MAYMHGQRSTCPGLNSRASSVAPTSTMHGASTMLPAQCARQQTRECVSGSSCSAPKLSFNLGRIAQEATSLSLRRRERGTSALRRKKAKGHLSCKVLLLRRIQAKRAQRFFQGRGASQCNSVAKSKHPTSPVRLAEDPSADRPFVFERELARFVVDRFIARSLKADASELGARRIIESNAVLFRLAKLAIDAARAMRIEDVCWLFAIAPCAAAPLAHGVVPSVMSPASASLPTSASTPGSSDPREPVNTGRGEGAPLSSVTFGGQHPGDT